MSVSKIKGNREFFGRTGSMLLGRYPDRPAPAHLVNGFISQIIGNSDYAPAFRKNLINDNLSEFKAVDKSILNNPKEIEKLGRCLKKAIFNPDGRAWVQIGSLTPIHAALVAYDPSEDGFGSGIGSLVIERDKKIVRHLKKLLIPDPKEHNDIITNLGIALVGKEGEDYNFKPRKKNDFGNLWSKSGSKLGKKFSERIADTLINLVKTKAIIRSDLIKQLTEAVHFFSVICSLRNAEILDKKPSSWSDLTPMFAYSGLPPGNQQKNPPSLQLSFFSYAGLIKQQYKSLENLIHDELKGKKLPKALPDSQKLAALLKATFKEVDIDDSLIDYIKTNVSDKANRRREIAKRLVECIYPSGHLERGYRAFGGKIGLAGPERGYGKRRFYLETPLLGLLVNLTVKDDERLNLNDWIGNVFDNYGIVLGQLKNDLHLPLLNKISHNRGDVISEGLKENEVNLTQRLIRSGLATEYSDGLIEVHR